MMNLFRSIVTFFEAETPLYAHRHRSIELIAEERGLDIKAIETDIRTVLKDKGRIEAITSLTKRFHVELAVAWRFVDKLD